ncbi:MAG: hypothetical protein AAGA81_21750, partial [Acidobacteriota bacterium]
MPISFARPGLAPLQSRLLATVCRRALSLLALCALPPLLVEPLAAQVPASEREVLIEIFESTNGSNWSHPEGLTINWLGGVGSECNWVGVFCVQDRVVGLDLWEFGLEGPFPAAITRLVRLNWLQLSGNRLSGALPSSLSSLRELNSLSVARNQLTGPLPESLGGLPEMTILDLFENSFTGTIPESWAALDKLIQLGVGSNALSGPIPEWLGELEELVVLDLFDNAFSGVIPESLTRSPELQFLFLGRNRLQGSIPASLGNLRQLVSLELSENELTGQLPASLGNLTELESLWLGLNRLEGDLPSSLGNLTKLTGLDLFDNRFSGPIPSTLGALRRVEFLSLGFNQISGPIPPELGRLSALKHLFLGGNRLSGTIPAELANLSQLQFIDLFSNQLEGEIPPELSRLSQLQSFDVGRNRLTGALPSALAELPKLQWVLLNSNAFDGEVPAAYGSFLNDPDRFVHLDWNALTATGPLREELRNFGFEYSQTLPPGEIFTQSIDSRSIAIVWDSPDFSELPGGTVVEVSSSASGPFTPATFVDGKTRSVARVEGLAPGQHFFRLRSVTEPHVNNQNRLISSPSAVVPGTTAPTDSRGALTFVEDFYEAAPQERKRIEVWRVGGVSGAIEARVQTTAFDEVGAPFASPIIELAWADGDASPRSFELPFGLPINGFAQLNLEGDIFSEGLGSSFVQVFEPPEDEFVLTSNGDQPELTQSPFGWQVAVWSAPDEDGQGVFVQVFDEFGQPVSATVRMNQEADGDQTQPAVAWDGDNDRFVSAWVSRSSSAETGAIVGRFFDPVGAPQGDEFEMQQSSPSEDVSDPVIAVRRRGVVVAAWVRKLSGSTGGRGNAQSAVVGRSFEPDGSAQGAATQLSDAGASASQPDLSSSGDTVG